MHRVWFAAPGVVLMKIAARIALLLAASAVLPGFATAADYDPPVIMDEAPEVVPVEVGSGWYLRGDLGYSVANKTGTYSYRTFDGMGGYGASTFTDAEVKKDLSYGIGFGYHFNDMLRADLTVDRMNTRFEGSTFSAFPCTPALAGTSCRSEDGADLDMYSIMASGYVDIATVAGFTPYVGAGAGYTKVNWKGLENSTYCVGCAGNGLVSVTNHPGANDWRFTWQAMAGVAYAVTKNLKLDLGYRYRQVEKGDMFGWDRASAAAGASGVQGFDGKLQQHEVRLGLRYDLW